MKFDVAIVGAGIVGAACALECAQAGLKVGVIESGIVGGGVTAEGMGHIAVMDGSEAELALCLYSQKLWDDMIPQLPSSCEVEYCGALWVAADDEELQVVLTKEKNYKEHGIKVEVLDARALKKWEPNLRDGLVGGLRVPGDSVVYSSACAKWMIDQAIDNDAQLILGKRVVELSGQAAILEDGETISADKIINAAGNAATTLTPDLPIRPRKGHLLITDRYPGFIKHQVIELGYLKSAHSNDAESVACNIQPRATGQLLIGSSREFGVEDRKVENRILKKMLQRAIEYAPGLSKLSGLRVWTGFRPATPDGLPLIGPHKQDENLLIAAGHEGLGISTSLATAKLIADQLLQRKSEIAIEPYLASRTFREAIHA